MTRPPIVHHGRDAAISSRIGERQTATPLVSMMYFFVVTPPFTLRIVRPAT
jgi:hypothetical protein